MRARGFTLIEMVMVLIIIAILVVFIAPILSQAVSAYDTISRNIEVLTKKRYAMERMAREIRMIRRDPVNTANYDIDTMTASTLEFCRDDGTRVTIAYNSGTQNLGIAYTTGFTSTCTASAVTTQTLTDAASAFTLTYLTSAGAGATGDNDVAYVNIDLTVTGTGTSAYQSIMRVDLRNP